MVYSDRWKYIYINPLRAFEEVAREPDLFKTGLYSMIIGTIIFSCLFQYTTANIIHPFLQALWALVFTCIWLPPALVSYAVLRIFGKKVSLEAHVESIYLGMQPLFLCLNLYFAGSILYHHLLVGDYPCYVAYARMGEWVWLAGLGALGFAISSIFCILLWWRVEKVKWYLTPLLWFIFVLSMAPVYYLYVLFT
jgi:hypothetical protein